MMFRRFFDSVFVVVLFSLVHIVSAQGGIFPRDGKEIAINRMEVLFDVRTENTIRQLNKIEYTGDSENFLWLIPLPPHSKAQISILDDDLPYFPHTIEYIGQESNPCGRLFGYEDGDYGVHPTPYNLSKSTTILSLDPDEIGDWLTNTKLRLDENMIDLIQQYADNDFAFALIETKRILSETSSNPFVASTYTIELSYSGDGTELILPLLLQGNSIDDRFGLLDNIGLEVSILGDEAYKVANFPTAEVNKDRIHPIHILDLVAWRNRESSMFTTEVMKTLQESESLTFVQTYGGWSESYASGSGYLTMFFSLMDRKPLNTFPIFKLAPNQADFTSIQLPEDDPLHFWRCSTRTLTVDEDAYNFLGGWKVKSLLEYVKDYETIKDALPQGNAYIPYAQLNIRYPEDWIMSTIDHKLAESSYTERLTVFSPETVTYETVESYISGDNTPPMLVIANLHYENVQGCICPSTPDFNAMDQRYLRLPNYIPDGHGVELYILTDEEDWKAKQDMYTAMLDFPFTYQYHVHNNLRHTLFMRYYQISYPDGWIEYLGDDNNPYFLPEGRSDISQAITIFRSLQPPLEIDQLRRETNPDAIIDKFIDAYGILPADADILRNSINLEACYIETPPLQFDNGERHGYIQIFPYSFVELSVANAIAIDDRILKDMIDSYYEADDDC